jgi:hypothetical protein
VLRETAERVIAALENLKDKSAHLSAVYVPYAGVDKVLCGERHQGNVQGCSYLESMDKDQEKCLLHIGFT